MPPPEENWMDTTDGPAWTWWLLAILPLVNKAQLAILGMTSLQKRLESIQKVLRYVSSKQQQMWLFKQSSVFYVLAIVVAAVLALVAFLYDGFVES